jgi:hypothetical protein
VGNATAGIRDRAELLRAGEVGECEGILPVSLTGWRRPDHLIGCAEPDCLRALFFYGLTLGQGHGARRNAGHLPGQDDRG